MDLDKWILDKSEELDSLNNDIQHYHDGFAQLYFSSKSTSSFSLNNLDVLNSFVTFCLETQRVGEREQWNLKPRPWHTMNHVTARELLSNIFATDGIDDSEYREISPEFKQIIIDRFFAQFQSSVDGIQFYSLSQWVASDKSFYTQYDFGTVFGSRGIVGVSKNRIGLFYVAGPEYWRGNPSITYL